MKRLAGIGSILTTALVTVGAKPGDAGWLLAGIIAAVLLVLGLPAALLLHAHRRDWIEGSARALERRATACVVAGAGILVAIAVLVALLATHVPIAALVVLVAATAWFLTGFSGGARHLGERLLGTGADTSLRPLVVGWLVRAGLFAVPLVGPLLGVYAVVAAFGAPLVALFERSAPVT